MHKSLKRLFTSSKKGKKRIIRITEKKNKEEHSESEIGRDNGAKDSEFLSSDEAEVLEQLKHDKEDESFSDDDSFDDKIYSSHHHQQQQILPELKEETAAGLLPPLAPSQTQSRKPLPKTPNSSGSLGSPLQPPRSLELIDPSNNSSGVYSTLGRSENDSQSQTLLHRPDPDSERQLPPHSSCSVPLIKMKSYQEIEREMKRRDSNLSLNEKIALRVMAKNTIVYEEPEEIIPEGLTAEAVDSSDDASPDTVEVDREMEAFIKPLETNLKRATMNSAKSLNKRKSLSDELTDMIKDVDNFIQDFSPTSPSQQQPSMLTFKQPSPIIQQDQPTFKAGNWALKNPSASPYSNALEANRLQQRLQETVVARNANSTATPSSRKPTLASPVKKIASPVKKSASPHPTVQIPDTENKVNGLISMWESKSASSSQPDLEMDSLSPAKSKVLPFTAAAGNSIVEEEEEGGDPVQALFLFISQLDMSETDPFILDHLVKAVGALAREREGKVDCGVQTAVMDWASRATVVEIGCQYDSVLGVDDQMQSSIEVWDVHVQSKRVESVDVDVQSSVVVSMDAEIQSVAIVSDSQCQHDASLNFKLEAGCQHDVTEGSSTSIETQCAVETANAECQNIELKTEIRVESGSQTFPSFPEQPYQPKAVSFLEKADAEVQAVYPFQAVDSSCQYEDLTCSVKNDSLSPPVLSISMHSLKKFSGDVGRSLSRLKRGGKKEPATSASSSPTTSPLNTSNSSASVSNTPSALPMESLVQSLDASTSPHMLLVEGMNEPKITVPPELQVNEEVVEANRKLYLDTMSKTVAAAATVQFLSPPVVPDLLQVKEVKVVGREDPEEENRTIVGEEREDEQESMSHIDLVATSQNQISGKSGADDSSAVGGGKTGGGHGLNVKKSFSTLSRLFTSKK